MQEVKMKIFWRDQEPQKNLHLHILQTSKPSTVKIMELYIYLWTGDHLFQIQLKSV